jgi:hypothetical protein
MAQLLHLPDLAAARPPARRRRGVAVAVAGGRVKQGEAGRVIRVADPVREGRMPPPLLAAPATPSESPPVAGRRGDEDDEVRQRYYLNMGYAIRTLREELPDVLYKEPSFDIYRFDSTAS